MASCATLRRAFVVLGTLAAALATPAAAQVPLLERQYLTGQWNGIRPLLAAHGFQPYLTYTGTVWSNLAGGRETGVQANGYLDFGRRRRVPRTSSG